jgi:hypothetical protein
MYKVEPVLVLVLITALVLFAVVVSVRPLAALGCTLCTEYDPCSYCTDSW